MTDTYHILVKKLDEFIRKYYKNLIIKGLIYSTALFFFFLLFVDVLEYLFHFGIPARTVVFYLFMAAVVIVVILYIIIPLIKLSGLGKTITHEQAADIIGKHFTEVRDKLLNTLQLRHIDSPETHDLVLASINQRIEALRPVPFTAAIKISNNKKYLKYALPPLLVTLILLFSAPTFIKEPTLRLIHHDQYYERMLPFKLVITNDKLEAFQQDDYNLKVEATGDEIPAEVNIVIDNNTFNMAGGSGGRFSYIFRNVQKNTRFMLVTDRYKSPEYELKVLPKPVLLNFMIDLDYPGYVNKKDETVENMGDLIIPEGTRVTWRFYTRDTDSLLLRINDSTVNTKHARSNMFGYSDIFNRSFVYSINPVNRYLYSQDSLFYTVSVIPDNYPVIFVEEFKDSVFDNRLYFRGEIKDDYGFNKLLFHYKKTRHTDKGEQSDSASQIMDINKNLSQQQFFHYFDIQSLDVKPDEQIEYYFEVWDNDAINGSKSSRSQKMLFRVPSLEEIETSTDNSNQQIKETMDQAVRDIKSLQNSIDELNQKLLDKKNITWQERQQIQDLLNRQEMIRKNIENLQRENSVKDLKEQQYKDIDKDLLDKQRQLQELFDKILSDDMKEQIKQLQDMLDSIDKDQVNNMLQKMKWTNKDLERELDRSLELFKRLEVEKKITEAIDKLHELARKQDDLSRKTGEAKKEEKEDLIKNQEGLNKDFEDFRQDMNEIDKKNSELEEPNNLINTESQEKDIEQEMQNSLEHLNQNRMNKASGSQQSASQKMKNLSNRLADMLSSMQQQGLGEDIHALREILENLIQVSFDQEDLMNELKVVKRNDPKYIRIIEEQKNIKDDLAMIEDSLVALSKRQIMIEPYVNKEIEEINDRIGKTIEDLNNRRIASAATNQQYTMTSVNNLALLLDEALQNMQLQMSQMMSGGSSTCPNPGIGAPSISNMRQLQEQLNKQLEQLKSGMESLKGKGTEGERALSEQLARLAAEQEAIRNQMQRYMEELKEQGVKDDGGMNQSLKDMDRTETELVNKIITNQTLMRQQQILTRLLQSEKAELMRDQEEKRESKEAKDQKISNPDDFFKYKGMKLQQVELLKTIPPSLNPFYKKKVNDYLFNFELQ